MSEPQPNTFRFRKQWLIHKNSLQHFPIENSCTFKLNHGYSLSYHPDLRIDFKECGDHKIIILGVCVDPLESQIFLQTTKHTTFEQDTFLKELLKAVGTYVIIVTSPNRLDLYTDPSALMPVYYNNDFCSSTPNLVPNTTRNQALDSEYPFINADQWYPGSLNPYNNLKSLIANHSLDLLTNKAKRFWPRNFSLPQLEYRQGIKLLAEQFLGSLEKLPELGRLLCSLTGGKDSRINLAINLRQNNPVSYFHLYNNNTKSSDKKIVKQFSERFQIAIDFIEVSQGPEWLKEFYDEISGGMAQGERRKILGSCLLLADRRAIHINGLLGAVAKGYYWPSDYKNKNLDKNLNLIIKDMYNPPTSVLSALQEWKNSLPEEIPSHYFLNLAYFEQRGGRGSSTGESGSTLFYESFTPFNNRTVVEIISSMPLEKQYSGNIHIDLANYINPALANIPYSKSTRSLGKYIPIKLKDFIKKIF